MLKLLLGLLLVAGCADRAATLNDALAAVDASRLTKRPGYEWRLIRANDLGDRWQLVFDISQGGTGGPAVIVVNKRSGEIVSAVSGQ